MIMEMWNALLKYPGLVKTINPVTVPITGVSIDTRSLEEGNIFFALRTDQADGHFFIPEAVKKGASVIVAEEEWTFREELDGNCSVWIVDDTLRALQDMAHLYRQQFDIPLLGITGSNGKTTIKEMLAHILSDKFNVLKNQGNFNNHLGVPLTLFKLDKDIEIAIVEMGTNHAGEIELLSDISEPSIAVVSNIGHAHIGNFSSLTALAEEKKSLLKYVSKRNGTIVLNQFDPLLKQDKYENHTITIGSDNLSDFYSSEVHIAPQINGIKFIVNDDVSVEIPIPGFHNQINALLSIAIASIFDFSIIKSAELLKTYSSSDKRMEIQAFNGYTIINDCYNASPESMAEALKYAQELSVRRNKPLVLVLGDMLELGVESPEYHENINLSLTSDNIFGIWLAGKNMSYLARSIENKNLKGGLHYAIEPEIWISDLISKIPHNSIILVKASRGMQLEKVVMAILSGKG